MALQLRKAKRSHAFLKMGMAAPSGGGKTAGSLLVAFGLMKGAYPKLKDAELWEKIAIIDTENGSGELYVNHEIPGSMKVGEYLVITLPKPFTAEKYIEAIRLCAANGIEVAIIDSTSHLWSGEGGLLEQQGNAAKRSGNSYTAWRDITPMHNQFVSEMLQTPMHVIATMRSKMEYSQEKDGNGKTQVRKLGMEPEQRKGMEYEFTTFFDIDESHNAFGSKDRTSIFDQKTFKIGPEVGVRLMEWLQEADTDDTQVIVAETKPAKSELSIYDLSQITAETIELCKANGARTNAGLMEILNRYDSKGNPNAVKDADKIVALNAEVKEYIATSTQTETEKENN